MKMESEPKPRIAISMVTYNAANYVENCLKSIMWIKEMPEVKLFIYDNSEDDKINQLISKYRKIPLTFTKSSKNLGFGAGHNRNYKIIEEFSPDFVLLLNPDMELRKESLVQLINNFNKISKSGEKVGIVGPKLTDGSKIEHSILHFYSPLSLGVMLLKELMGKKRPDVTMPLDNKSVDGISGACMLISNKLIQEVGLFDEDYFMYYEDGDFCTRSKKAGWKIYYLPNIEAKHAIGRSSDHLIEKERWLKERMILSSLLFFKKNHSTFDYVQMMLIWRLSLALRVLLNKDSIWAKSMYRKLPSFF